MQSFRRLLYAEHRKKPRVLSVRTAAEQQLLMVHFTGNGSTVALRTANELQSPGEIMHTIPYRLLCGLTLFEGWLDFLGYTNRLTHWKLMLLLVDLYSWIANCFS